ncbi:hypothetical protein J437_LFUL008701 [Ladona fulva]|uniref:Mutator-like transposase domain-containing protein n=1 Tax=Ladona fulva TaxID=123851 RepID=A0A8K0P513_LADFU|nr:hypothetical protein J437_LFUL008701 [Ladona fulva]
MSGRKGSHEQHQTEEFRKDVRRRKFSPKNPHTAERDTVSTSTSAKKFRSAHNVPVPEEETIGYSLLNFLTVFSAIRIGLGGAKKFCGIMDLPPPVAQKSYDAIVKNIQWAVQQCLEFFLKKQSKECYGIKYVNYIGDSDSKTYKGVLDVKPYGDGFAINKRECIGHVQKRMGMHLRQCMKKNKGVVGRNKLSEKMIDKLPIYYGLAIRRNNKSVGRMRDAIWAIYYHYQSNDEKPILAMIRGVLGGRRRQRGNWLHTAMITNRFRIMFCSCIFNEGNVTLLKVMQVMGVKCGNNVHSWAVLEDAGRLSRAEYTAMSSTREGRAARKERKMEEVSLLLRKGNYMVQALMMYWKCVEKKYFIEIF